MPAKRGAASSSSDPAWYDAAYERFEEREHPRLRGVVGEERWRIGRDLAASEGPAGSWEATDPDLQDEELQAMVSRLQFMRDNLLKRPVRFEPHRHTTYVLGRPVQANMLFFGAISEYLAGGASRPPSQKHNFSANTSATYQKQAMVLSHEEADPAALYPYLQHRLYPLQVMTGVGRSKVLPPKTDGKCVVFDWFRAARPEAFFLICAAGASRPAACELQVLSVSCLYHGVFCWHVSMSSQHQCRAKHCGGGCLFAVHVRPAASAGSGGIFFRT